MAKKQNTEPLIVRTPDLIASDWSADFVDPKDDDLISTLSYSEAQALPYFCESDLLLFFDIPPTAKEIHVEGSRSPWCRNCVRFQVKQGTVTDLPQYRHADGRIWLDLYYALEPFITELGIAEGKTGYIYIRVLYND